MPETVDRIAKTNIAVRHHRAPRRIDTTSPNARNWEAKDASRQTNALDLYSDEPYCTA